MYIYIYIYTHYDYLYHNVITIGSVTPSGCEQGGGEESCVGGGVEEGRIGGLRGFEGVARLKGQGTARLDCKGLKSVRPPCMGLEGLTGGRQGLQVGCMGLN